MEWYDQLELPSFTPPGEIIGFAWTLIFILSAISIIIVWNQSPRNSNFRWIVVFLLINGFFNVFWSFLFFNQGLIGLAVIDAVLLAISVMVLIYLIFPVSETASLLFLPYAFWVIFATFLNYAIWLIN